MSQRIQGHLDIRSHAAMRFAAMNRGGVSVFLLS
jgi:hypothetical protein